MVNGGSIIFMIHMSQSLFLIHLFWNKMEAENGEEEGVCCPGMMGC